MLSFRVCDVGWDELLDRQSDVGVGEAVCRIVCQPDFLKNGAQLRYWDYGGRGMTLCSTIPRRKHSILSPEDPTPEGAESTNLSKSCIALGWILVCVNIGQSWFSSSDTTKELLDSLFGVQIVLAAGAYRSRKLRFLRLVPNAGRQRGKEVGAILASILCGLTTTAAPAEMAIITTPWILGAYALAGTYGRAGYEKARRAFDTAKYADAARPLST